MASEKPAAPRRAGLHSRPGASRSGRERGKAGDQGRLAGGGRLAICDAPTQRVMENFPPMYFFVAVFFVLSLVYLWPLVAEVIGGVQKTREGKPARWEGFLNLFILPFLVVAAAFAAHAISWIPP